MAGSFQRHCFFQKLKVLYQEKHLNSISHEFIHFFSVYVLFFSYPVPFQSTVLRHMDMVSSMFFLLKYLFCFFCRKAAKETTCIWAQSNNKTIALLDVTFFKETMLLHVCDFWDHTLKKGHSRFFLDKITLQKLKLKKADHLRQRCTNRMHAVCLDDTVRSMFQRNADITIYFSMLYHHLSSSISEITYLLGVIFTSMFSKEEN